MRLEIMNGPKLTMPMLRTLGDRMRYRRRQLGWTQDELAMHAGTNQAVIQKIENGKSLRPRKIDEIAEVLEVPPSWLMFGEDPNNALSDEAMELAETWQKLSEYDRLRISNEVNRLIRR